MNFGTVRRWLTAAYVGVALVVVVPFGLMLARSEADRIDGEARRLADERLLEVLSSPDPTALALDDSWVVNPADRQSSAFGASTTEPPLFAVAAEALDADESVEVRYSQDDVDYVVVARRVDDVSAFAVAVDITEYADRITAARVWLVVGGAVAVAVPAIVGWFITGRALRPARRSMENQRDFVADAAHEMRTPLAVIQASASQTLQRDRSVEEYRNALAEIRTAATRASEGVGELLELARLDAGQAQPRLAPLRLDLLAEEVAASVIVDGVSIIAETPPRPVVVSADYLLLRQAVENLARNAAARAASVSVLVGEEDGKGVVRVTDDGPGFDPDQLPTVFERFRRGDTKGGAGLGLAIARSIVELHGGEIHAENGTPTGAVVVVTLDLR